MTKDKRLFAQFTLDFPDGPKIVGLSDAAFRAFVEIVCYSREYLTDGFIAAGVARKRWTADALQELCSNHDERPSLIAVDGGWRIHDFAKHQMTTADIAVKRAAGAAGGRAKAAKRLAGATDLPQQSGWQNGSAPLQRSESQMTTPSDTESSHDPAAREVTDAMKQPSAMTAKLAGQQGIDDLGAVVDAVARHARRSVSADGAFRVCMELLGKAKSQPVHPAPYVLRSIERTPAEVQQFIDRELIAL